MLVYFTGSRSIWTTPKFRLQCKLQRGASYTTSHIHCRSLPSNFFTSLVRIQTLRHPYEIGGVLSVYNTALFLTGSFRRSLSNTTYRLSSNDRAQHTVTTQEKHISEGDTGTSRETEDAVLSRDDLKDLVWDYETTTDESQLDAGYSEVGYRARDTPTYFTDRSGPARTTPHQERYRRPFSNNVSELLREFWREWNKPNVSSRSLFQAYQAIPSPRLEHFSEKQAHDILQKSIHNDSKTESGMLQYMTLIDDMKLSGISITRKEWNTAISFVGRSFDSVRDIDVQSALFFWREMEKGAGIEPTTTTFNILYDIVSKSQMTHLPDLILQEMRRRKLKPDRYTYVGMIAYRGRCGNGSAVRKAYRDLVNAGEIVDTVVLNAVMGALIAAGEPQGALQILERMKAVQPPGKSPEISGKRRKRKMGYALKTLANIRRVGGTVKMDIPESIIAPDLISFSMVMNHYCEQTADFEQACNLLDDMTRLGIFPGRPIYQALFKGFALHGNLRYSPWTTERLEMVYNSFLEADVSFGRNLALWCLKAHVGKSGRQRSDQVLDNLHEKWKGDVDDEDLAFVLERYRSMK